MPDYFEQSQERINRKIGQRLKQSDREVGRRYALALNQIRTLLATVFERYEIGGVLSLEEMSRYSRLNDLFQQIEFIMGQSYAEIAPMIYDALGFNYQTAFNLSAYAIESTAATNLALTTAGAAAVTAAIYEPIDKLTLPQRLEKNRAQIVGGIRRKITVGLADGSTYRTMAEGVKDILEGDAKKAMATVRTETHRVVERAKEETAKRADEAGVIMEKTWNTVHDERVRRRPRDSADHKMLDGKSLPMDADFKGVKGRGPAPGQMGHPAEDINCRCFLTYKIVEIAAPDLPKLESMTFAEWERLKSQALT